MARNQEPKVKAAPGCPVCGAEARGDASFCSHCGAHLTSNGSGSHTPAPDPRPAAPPPSTSPAPETLHSPFSYLSTQSAHFWQGLAIGLAATVLILFLVAAIAAN